MEQQHESALVERLEHLGIAGDVSPTGTTLTYGQIYTSGRTLEEAFITFWASFEQVRGLAHKAGCQLVKVDSGCPTSTMEVQSICPVSGLPLRPG
jgi:hypothetical protein